jgi:tRNA 2-thiouridine synthesizing protein E
MLALTVNDRTVDVDDDGYLLDVNDWDEDVAVALAESEMLEMTEDHWGVVGVLRDYYAKYQVAPHARALMKLIRDSLGKEKGKSKYLYELFPKGPAKQGFKIAGLKKPAGCV